MSPAEAPPALLTNIGTLAAVPRGPLRGAAMRIVPQLRDAAMLVENGKITWFGPAANLPEVARQPSLPRVDCRGGTLVPGLIDCHTHIPFAGDRAGEFMRRIAGESYLSIMQSGGGIRVTCAAVRRASLDELIELNLPRLQRMLRRGVTTVECKSGYGLSPEHELKQLRAIRALAGRTLIELIPTYFGVHAVPAEYEGRADAFVEAMSAADLLRSIADERLARFCDVFCDAGAFDVPQSRRVLQAAARAGLKPKIHADELAQIGASRLAGELRAVSADHLEHLDHAGSAALRAAGTIAVLLPGTSFFLGIAHADARAMLAAELSLALATDFNPGSSMVESLQFVMHIACCQLRMHPLEVLSAVTTNAAAAICESDRLGAIEIGMQADLLLLDCPTVEHWLYEVGRDAVSLVFKRGALAYTRENPQRMTP